MKIPFDIKFRPQIESGEYKVETEDGREVKIISFDVTDANDCPIAGLFRLCAGTPTVGLFDEHGSYKGEGSSDYNLVIITTETERKDEFEKALDDYLMPIKPYEIQETPYTSMERIARHFYELGLNARKED